MDTKKDVSFYQKQVEDLQSGMKNSMAKLSQHEEEIRRLTGEKGGCA